VRKFISHLIDRRFEDPHEAVDVTNKMRRWSARSAMFDGDLTSALFRQARRRLRERRYDDALTTLDEILWLHSRARRIRRSAWEAWLANTNRFRGLALFHLGRLPEALAAADDSVRRGQELVRHHAWYEENQLHAIHVRAMILWKLGRHTDALEAAQQGLHAARTLIAHGRQHDTEQFLTPLCGWLLHLERHDEGARYGEEAVQRLRERQAPAAELAGGLADLGGCLLPGRPEEALTVTVEAISLLEAVDGDEHEQTLRYARHNRARALERLGS
jgi:tetratricopeptide (TPR) repeat protein